MKGARLLSVNARRNRVELVLAMAMLANELHIFDSPLDDCQCALGGGGRTKAPQEGGELGFNRQVLWEGRSLFRSRWFDLAFSQRRAVVILYVVSCSADIDASVAPVAWPL